MFRRDPILGPLVTFLSAGVFAPTPVLGQGAPLQTVNGTSPAGWFGFAVASAGDVNGDGVPDFIAGAPAVNSFSGRAHLISGQDGTQLFQFNSPFAGSMFGGAVAGLGDVDGDGTPDVAVGVFYASSISKNYCRVLSGADGSALHMIQGEDGKGLGTAIASVGDVNGDGKNDILIGIPYSNEVLNFAGRARIYSGADASPLLTVDPLASAEWQGYAVAGLGDVNLDGVPDFAAGALFGMGAGNLANAGVVRVYSGVNGALLYSVSGIQENESFGAEVAGGGDLNGDGVPDFVASGFGSPGIQGRTQSYSGADGAPIKSYKGSVGEGLGNPLAIVGDVNGDGRADVLLGMFKSSKVVVLSGPTGSVLATYKGLKDDGTGSAVAPAGDVNGDGVPDILLGAPYADVYVNNTPTGSVPGVVRTFAYSGAVAATKIRIALQRESSEPAPGAFGALDLQVAKGNQSVKISTGKLPAGPGDEFHVFLETAPASGVFEHLATLALSNPKTGSWSATLQFKPNPFAALDVAFLTQLAGRKVEVRDGADQVVLWAILPAGTAAKKISIPLALGPDGIAGTSGALTLEAGGPKGTSKFGVATKKLSSTTAYSLELEDAPGAGTFTQIGTIVKGKFVLDTKSGTPLPFGAASVLLYSGRKVRVLDGAAILLEATIP